MTETQKKIQVKFKNILNVEIFNEILDLMMELWLTAEVDDKGNIRFEGFIESMLVSMANDNWELISNEEDDDRTYIPKSTTNWSFEHFGKIDPHTVNINLSKIDWYTFACAYLQSYNDVIIKPHFGKEINLLDNNEYYIKEINKENKEPLIHKYSIEDRFFELLLIHLDFLKEYSDKNFLHFESLIDYSFTIYGYNEAMIHNKTDQFVLFDRFFKDFIVNLKGAKWRYEHEQKEWFYLCLTLLMAADY